MDTPPCKIPQNTGPLGKDDAKPALTVDDMLRRYGLLVGLVAYFIGFWGYEVDELRAAVNHKLPGVVSHSHVGESFFYHLVDSCSGDGEVVVVSRGRSHRGRHKWAQSKTNDGQGVQKSLRSLTGWWKTDVDTPSGVDGVNVYSPSFQTTPT